MATRRERKIKVAAEANAKLKDAKTNLTEKERLENNNPRSNPKHSAKVHKDGTGKYGKGSEKAKENKINKIASGLKKPKDKETPKEAKQRNKAELRRGKASAAKERGRQHGNGDEFFAGVPNAASILRGTNPITRVPIIPGKDKKRTRKATSAMREAST